MSGYVRAIIILSVLSGIIKALLSEGKTKKYVNYLIGLIMVTVIVLPFKSFITEIDIYKEKIYNFMNDISFQEKIDSSNSIIVNTTKDKVCRGIKDALITKFNFDERDVFIELIIDDSELSSIKITGVNITLTNKASWSNVDSVKAYIENLIGVNTNVKRK